MNRKDYLIFTIASLLIIGLVLSMIFVEITNHKFEERYGRKPENVCEGSVSLGVIPMGYCEDLLSSKQESKK